MKANDVSLALRNRYSDSRRYAIAEEVGLSTGFSHRRLDMIVLDCYWSNGFRIDGFEIKVSTADLRRELEDPEKHIAFFDVIDYYTLAVPPGVVDPLFDVIPKKWGILIVNEDGSTQYRRKPLALEDKKSDRDVPRGFLASITRSIQSHQPSAEELQREYERGSRETKDSLEREWKRLNLRVAEEADKLKAYDELSMRFRLYGDDAAKAMDEFEAFRKLDVHWVQSNIETTINHLKRVEKALHGEKTEDKI